MQHDLKEVQWTSPGVQVCRRCGAQVAVTEEARSRSLTFCSIVDEWVAGLNRPPLSDEEKRAVVARIVAEQAAAMVCPG
jgi:hypothetical protein